MQGRRPGLEALGDEAVTLIIGGGFAGLYTSAITEGHVIAMEDPWRTITNNYIFLRWHLRNRRMLTNLGFTPKRESFKIGYFSGGRVHAKPTMEMVNAYLRKAYPEQDHNKVSPLYFLPEYSTCGVDYLSVLERLEFHASRAGRITFGKVTGIDLLKRTVTSERGTVTTTHPYDKLVVTVPLPVFFRLCGLDVAEQIGLSATPISLYKSDMEANGFRQVMNMDPKSPVLRWVVSEDGVVTEERLGTLEGEKPLAFFSYGKIMETYPAAKEAVLLTLEASGVYVAGRFAEWKSHYDTEDAVARAEELATKLV
jgi:hypothetical protein